ncbi:MAG TPA: hypothetical protein VFT98_21430 [Myxococcota bacterium]|nr:hypothetical protein [Myxococcota bacterium]
MRSPIYWGAMDRARAGPAAPQLRARVACVWLLTCVALLLAAARASAQTPISLFRSYAGNIQFTGTAGTLRSQPNSVNACSLNASGTRALSGIPAGATVVAAHLYWAGSGATVDANVTFAGPFGSSNLVADRTFTETYVNGGNTFRFFSGHEDVTGLVTANGNYTLSNLAVTNNGIYCTSQAVVSAWSLIVVYSRPAEPLRVVNIADGFQAFRGAQISILDNNFEVPASGIDAFVSHVTWEGDVENSSTFNGQTENLVFQGTALTDAFNPLNNQFNSASNIIGSTTTYGADFDRYNVTALVTPGQTSATTQYSSGGDLVLLTAEIFSVTNTPVADLAIAKTHSGNFTTGQNGDYTITVSNAGPNSVTGTTTVTDTLPAGLTYVSGTGTGWSCSAAAQVVTCTHAGPLASGASLPALTLTVAVAANAPSSLTNTASVSSPAFDNVAGNDSASDPTTIVQLPDPLVIKSQVVLADPVNGAAQPKAIPGANVRYTIGVTNQGSGSPDVDSLVIDDALPPELDLYVNGFGGPSPVLFVDGATASGLSLVFGGLASATDDIEFDDGASTFTYTPVPDANGYDAAVRALRIRPSGTFAGASGATTPSFELRFQTRVK